MMKYVTPKAEVEMVETTDIMLISMGNYEIEFSGEGNGNVVFSASNLFGQR